MGKDTLTEDDVSILSVVTVVLVLEGVIVVVAIVTELIVYCNSLLFGIISVVKCNIIVEVPQRFILYI